MTQRYTEEDWQAHYERMNNFMTTKSDRNLPAEGERSLRYNTGKPDYSLIPIAAMQEAAKATNLFLSKLPLKPALVCSSIVRLLLLTVIKALGNLSDIESKR